VTEKNNFTYSTRSEKLIDELKKVSEKEKMYEPIKNELKEMNDKLVHDKKNDLNKDKDLIKRLLEQEICAQYFLNQGRIESTIQSDKEVSTAIELLKNKKRVQGILTVKK
jgi:carboxyl-terminal processing protease